MDNFKLVMAIKNKAKNYLDTNERDIRVIEAMLRVDRIDFIPADSKQIAYNDSPVSIGYNQTCSQPSMVAFMLDKLEIKPGNKILEIGAGSGYASAIASLLCIPGGFVYASEIIPDLVGKMRYNLTSYIDNIKIISDDGSSGFPQYAPFDRIFISAGVSGENSGKSGVTGSHEYSSKSGSNFDPKILLNQLNDNGILLYPENYGNLYKIKKTGDKFIKETFYGVSFVPLRGKNS